MEKQILALQAKLIVQELLLASLLIELAKTSPKNVELLRAIYRPVEDQLIQAMADAPADQRELVEATRAYFTDLTHNVLALVPHHGNH